MDEFLAGLACATGIALGLMTLTPITDGVKPQDYDRAIKVCIPHDGVKYVYRPRYANSDYTTLCNDGVKIEQASYRD